MTDDSPTDSLQCLDLKARSCTLLSTSLPVKCAGALGTRTYSAYFLFTTSGEMMKFDADTAKFLSMDRVHHFKRKRFCVAVHHDKLLVVAGEDGQQVMRGFSGSPIELGVEVGGGRREGVECLISKELMLPATMKNCCWY